MPSDPAAPERPAWVVATISDGVLFGATSKRACCDLIEQRGAPIRESHRTGPGDYYVRAYHDTDQDARLYFVMRVEIAYLHGLEPPPFDAEVLADA
jgi:hypothetical protein